MHLNIKNDEAHKLATELAELTGESLTSAVTLALRERLARERRRRGVAAGRYFASRVISLDKPEIFDAQPLRVRFAEWAVMEYPPATANRLAAALRPAN